MRRALVAVGVLTLAATPLSAHGSATCSQMTVAANVMQREVDGLRVSAKHSTADAKALVRKNPQRSRASLADAKLFTLRASVEQDRVSAIRHNILHCSNVDDDAEGHK